MKERIQNREELLILLQIEKTKREEERLKRIHLEKQLERYLHPGNIKREETCRNLETYSNEEDMDTSE